MMRSRLILAITLATTLVGCSVSDSTSPAVRQVPTVGASASGGLKGPLLSDDGPPKPAAAPQSAQCGVMAPMTNSMDVGPAGGTLYVGGTSLIIPAGALDKIVHITGTIQPGPQVAVDFQPRGLQFKKAAGLNLNASVCGATAPNVIYLDDQGGILQHITSIFSDLWHTWAAPIDHFSTYAVDV